MKNTIKLTERKRGFILEADGQTLSILYDHCIGGLYECTSADEKTLMLIYKYKDEINKFLSKRGKQTFTGSYWMEGCDIPDCGYTFQFKNGKVITKDAWKDFKSVEFAPGVCEWLDCEPEPTCVNIWYYN